MVEVNYLAVLLCGLSAMVLGSIWYGPLFGKMWTASMGWTPEQLAAMKADPKSKKKMMRSYGIMLIGAFVTAYVLSHILTFGMSYLETSGAAAGISTGFWIWLGFVAPVTMSKVLWEGKSWRLWIVDAGYYLIDLVIMGAIIASMM